LTQPSAGSGFDPTAPEVRSNVLLGDLHLKQKEPARAVEAYQKALELLQKELHLRRWLDAGAATTAEQQKLYTAIELHTKLAQAQLLAGDNDSARKSLEAVTNLAKSVEQLAAKGAKAPAAKDAIPLPSRLIISVPKKVLDQAGSGKMTFDEFRKAAKVEYLKFDTPGKGEGGEESSSGAKFRAAESCFNHGQYREALQIYNELAQTGAGGVEGLDALGGMVRCHAALGQQAEVRQRLEDIRRALATQDDPAVRQKWEEWVTSASKALTAP
jgi:tetratricopeptide (TPR) repeat protein